MSGKPSSDHELERLLAGEETATAALYRRLPAAEPDAALDAAVLAMAHRAVNPHLRATLPARARARLHPWWLALGSAAGLVLAAGVAWQLRSTIEQNSRESALRGVVAPAAEGRIEVQARDEPAHRADHAVPAAPTPAAAPAAAAANVEPQASAAPAGATAQGAVPAERTESAPAPARATRSRREEQPGVTEYTLPSGAAGPAPRPFPAAPAPEAAATPAVAPPAEEGLSKAQAARLPADAAEDAVERKARLASGARPPDAAGEAEAAATSDKASGSATPAPPLVAPNRSAVLQQNLRLPPATWVGLMQQLLREGRRAEARDNLALFQRKYPAYRLPPELAALSREP
ncbi:MAG TPA: hypothetical protein PLN91_03335 [Rhodanobacteraceae bacterium]|nr:hypothetical protein [Rhodanobacteraceae bacterium]